MDQDRDRLDEILRRLEAIERRLEDHDHHLRSFEEGAHGQGHEHGHAHGHEHGRGHEHGHGHPHCREERADQRGCCGHGHRSGRGGCGENHHRDDRGPPSGFDEKRVVDLIVRLVGERVERLLEKREAGAPPPAEPPEKP